MSVPGAHAGEEAFDLQSERERTPITFRNGEIILYHRAASLDLGAAVLQKEMAEFVKDCSRVRRSYSLGVDVAAEEAALQDRNA